MAGAHETFELDEIYGPDELAAIERGSAGPTVAPERPHRRPGSHLARRGAGGALAVGMALGLREVFEPTPEDADVEHWSPSSTEPGAVTVFLDFDDPRRSVAVVRPWLLGLR
ncbi:MAG: hypothetical protein S0880_02785 [Actinomycetota bacterium]|nr:hypothetical protein [Actinomycetota bacterium]